MQGCAVPFPNRLPADPVGATWIGLKDSMVLKKKISKSGIAKKRSGTQSIQRAAFLLRTIAGNNRTGLRLMDLVRISALEVSTAHRILKSLVAENLVRQDASSRLYHLGPLIFEAGLAATQQYSLRDLCQDTLRRIADTTGDTAFLNLRRDCEAVCIERKDGAFPIKVFSLNIGDRRPLGIGAGGMAILCNLPDEEVERIADEIADVLPRYGKLNQKLLLSLVKRSRERGYVLHKLHGLGSGKAVGVPIRNQSGDPIAALSIAAITSRMGQKRCEDLVALLKKEAAKIERLISNKHIGRPE